MYFIILIVIIIVIIFFHSPTGKGIWGEFWVNIALGKNIPNEKYIINNLKLVYDGKTYQIDHLIISRRGIFVIETKNYVGRIYGEENHYQWTQVLKYGKVKNKLYNPINKIKHIFIY